MSTHKRLPLLTPAAGAQRKAAAIGGAEKSGPTSTHSSQGSVHSGGMRSASSAALLARTASQTPPPLAGVTATLGGGTIKKKNALHGPLKEIPYDYLQDKALAPFLNQSNVQSLLERNGWLAENAPCCLCGVKNAGAIKVCTECHRFYHMYCLPPLPLDERPIRVLLLHTSKSVLEVKQQIFKTGRFLRVDDVNYNKYVVQLDMIRPYDAVMVFNGNNVWINADMLGDMLAAYVDGGGGVVLSCLSTAEALGGRWRRLKYSPVFPGRDRTGFRLALGQVNKPFHPLLTDVRSFDGGNMSFHVSGAVNERGTVICRWTNGQPLVVVLDQHPTVPRGRVVYLNFYPFSSNTRPPGAPASDAPAGVEDSEDPDYWDTNTDGCLLMANALRFASHPTYHTAEGPFACFQCTGGEQNGSLDGSVTKLGAPSREQQLIAVYNTAAVAKTQSAVSKAPAPSPSPQPGAGSRATSVAQSTKSIATTSVVDVELLKNIYREKLAAERQNSASRRYLRQRSADAAAVRPPSAGGLTYLPPLEQSTAAIVQPPKNRREFSLATETILSADDVDPVGNDDLLGASTLNACGTPSSEIPRSRSPAIPAVLDTVAASASTLTSTLTANGSRTRGASEPPPSAQKRDQPRAGAPVSFAFDELERVPERPAAETDHVLNCQLEMMQAGDAASSASSRASSAAGQGAHGDQGEGRIQGRPVWKDKPAHWERRQDALESNDSLTRDSGLLATAGAQIALAPGDFAPVPVPAISRGRRASVSSTGSGASFTIIRSKKRITVMAGTAGSDAQLSSGSPPDSAGLCADGTGSSSASGLDSVRASSGKTRLLGRLGAVISSEDRQDAKLSRPGSASNPIQLTAAQIGVVESLVAAIQDRDVASLISLVCFVCTTQQRSEWKTLAYGYEVRTETNLESAIASAFPNHFGVLLRHLVGSTIDLECAAAFDALKQGDLKSLTEIVLSTDSNDLIALRKAYSLAYGVRLSQVVLEQFHTPVGRLLKVLLEGHLVSAPLAGEESPPVEFTFDFVDRILRRALEAPDPRAVLAANYDDACTQLLLAFLQATKDPLGYLVRLLQGSLESPMRTGRILAHLDKRIVHVCHIYKDIFRQSLHDDIMQRVPNNDYRTLLHSLLTPRASTAPSR